MEDELTPGTGEPKPYMNPYVAGVLLGLTLLASFLVLGTGLGASGGIARIGAYAEGLVVPDHVAQSEYFGGWGTAPLRYYLVYMFIGIVLGSLFSALLQNRVRPQLERGKSCSRGLRMTLALVGGLLAGFASRLAGGCTSGQALTGSALLLTGSLVFLVCLFAGGYAAAAFVGRQWHD